MSVSHSFEIILSLLNTLSFCIPIGVLVFVPGTVYMRLYFEIYGVSLISLLGPWILFGGIPVMVVTYAVISRERMKIANKGIAVCLVEFGAISASLLNFRPYPDMFILGWGSFYGLITGLIVICHYHVFDLRASDKSIDKAARVERIKLEYETWFRGLLTMVAFVAAVYGIIVLGSFNMGTANFTVRGNITEDVLKAALDTQIMMQISMLYFGILFAILGVIMIKKIIMLSNQLNEIKSK